MPIDIDPSEYFDPSTLDFDNSDMEKKYRIRAESAQKNC